MPSYRGHIFGYAVLSIIFLALNHHYSLLPSFSLLEWVAAVAVGGFYSILPDVDTPSSKARRLIEVSSLSIIILSLITYTLTSDITLVKTALLLSTMLLLLWFLKHRGRIHGLASAVLLTLPIYLLNPLAGGFAFLGYVSHLIFDGKFKCF